MSLILSLILALPLSFADEVDPFDVLGIPRGSSVEVAKSARNRLAQTLHPDRNVGSAFALYRLQEINAAYDRIKSMPASPNYEVLQRYLLSAGSNDPFLAIAKLFYHANGKAKSAEEISAAAGTAAGPRTNAVIGDAFLQLGTRTLDRLLSSNRAAFEHMQAQLSHDLYVDSLDHFAANQTRSYLDYLRGVETGLLSQPPDRVWAARDQYLRQIFVRISQLDPRIQIGFLNRLGVFADRLAKTDASTREVLDGMLKSVIAGARDRQGVVKLRRAIRPPSFIEKMYLCQPRVASEEI